MGHKIKLWTIIQFCIGNLKEIWFKKGYRSEKKKQGYNYFQILSMIYYFTLPKMETINLSTSL